MLGSPSHLSSPPSPAQALSSTNRNAPSTPLLVDIIGAQFPAFDCESAVIFPFQDDTARDEAFQKDLNEMLFDAALQTHVWASARPFHEADIATRKYERQIMAIQGQENQQEKTRQKLNEFVTRMRSALAALTGTL
ncbi:hypothetical protein B0H13DRAFT_1990678 [Mycena leptocephala]|nr:hypothetical protein B0H13DRAFT_1990678 [Mycena leptocephala]